MPKKNSQGPFVAFAVFCEKPLQEKDGVLSLIRVVDRIEITATGQGVPEEIPPAMVDLTLCIGLKSGAAKGRHNLTLQLEDPSGAQLSSMNIDVLFEGEERGCNVISRMIFAVKLEGLYWLHVSLGASKLTQVPLRIVYRRISTGS